MAIRIMDTLDPFDLALHRAKVHVHRALRFVADRRAPLPPARRSRLLVGLPQIASVSEQLYGAQIDARELPLELGKIENLRVAGRMLDGLEFEAGQVFSFWAQVGPPLRARGFVEGRELREGCVVPGIAGGLCLLSNGLYRASVAAGFELLERHAHSRRPPGSRAAAGEDATVAWNYVDLRFVASHAWRLELHLDAEQLHVGIRAQRRRACVPVISERRSEPTLTLRTPPAGEVMEGAAGGAWAGEAGRSCLSCEQPCSAARRHRTASPSLGIGRRSWLLDAAWPEYTALVRAEAERGDRLLQPIDGARLQLPRYAWPRPAGVELGTFPVRTLARSLRARQLAAQGPARQRAMLADDLRLASAMAAALEPRDTRLVVSQTLLPHLFASGALGGREVVVLMQRLPLLELQARLDEGAARQPQSSTLADFRADPLLVEAEARALDEAAQIVTPHAGVAACFPGRARLLSWTHPRAQRVGSRRHTRAGGPLRLLFPASTVGRKGAWELRAALFERVPGSPPLELHVTGRALEGPGFWRGLDALRVVEGVGTGLDRVDGLVLPAWVEHEPRILLRALARGLPVIATQACGLSAQTNLCLVPAGDVVALGEALEAWAVSAVADAATERAV